MSKKVYEIVTEKIIKGIKEGKLTWNRTWTGGKLPKNFKTKKRYKGINILLLMFEGFSCPYWLTFKQVNELGGKVKKGARSSIIVYWKILEKDNGRKDKHGKTKLDKIPFLRYYRVFNLEQTEGIEWEQDTPLKEFTPIEQAEAIIKGYESIPEVKHIKQKAYYSHQLDYINMPKKETFNTEQNYYSTLFHELVHSTGHETRLKRDGVIECTFFGSTLYSQEELVAEIGASFLCALTGIQDKTFKNSIAYIQGWLEKLENNPKLILWASARAQKAVDYILGKLEKKTAEQEKELELQEV